MAEALAEKPQEDQKQAKLDVLERQIAAARRQKRAIEARSEFLSFVKFTMPDPDEPGDIDRSMFKDAKHHRALAKVLEEVEKGHIPRLIVIDIFIAPDAPIS